MEARIRFVQFHISHIPMYIGWVRDRIQWDLTDVVCLVKGHDLNWGATTSYCNRCGSLLKHTKHGWVCDN